MEVLNAIEKAVGTVSFVQLAVGTRFVPFLHHPHDASSQQPKAEDAAMEASHTLCYGNANGFPLTHTGSQNTNSLFRTKHAKFLKNNNSALHPAGSGDNHRATHLPPPPKSCGPPPSHFVLQVQNILICKTLLELEFQGFSPPPHKTSTLDPGVTKWPGTQIRRHGCLISSVLT